MRPASTVVVSTVRLLAPFVLIYGLFTMFHGTSSVGGGFQGGVIVGATIVMVSFAFGIEQTQQLFGERLLATLAVCGVLVFGVVAVGSLVFGGAFLEVGAYPFSKAAVYGTELIEVGIGITVATTVVTLVFLLARGIESDGA